MSLAATTWTFAAGVAFGLALAAPPGPMNAVIAEESVVRGWIAGVTAGLGAMTADFVFFVLSLAGVVAFLDDAPTVRGLMIAGGGLLMLYFAADAVGDVRSTFTASDDGSGSDAAPEAATGADDGAGDATGAAIAPVRTRGFRRALALALTNPYQIVFWLTVGVGLLRPGTVDVLAALPVVGTSLAGSFVVRTGSPALLVGLFGGIAVWITGFPAMLVTVGKRIDSFAPTVTALSALVLAGFGVTFLWTAADLLVV